MNLLEYRAKQILVQHGIEVPYGITADSTEKAVDAAKKVHAVTSCSRWVVKAQVNTGGRGKAGGIRIASSIKEVEQISGELLGKHLVTHQSGTAGEKINLLLIEEFIPLNCETDEMYLSLMLNRQDECNTLIYSKYGGMDVEEITDKHPSNIYKYNINPIEAIDRKEIELIPVNLSIPLPYHEKMISFAKKLYFTYLESDALLLEINPLVLADDGRIIPLDAKMSIDDNAIFRHNEMLDVYSENDYEELEAEAKKHQLNYVKLNGNVACMVNGAGLAMASMDLITLAGGSPANFLDVGGTADSNRVEKAFRILLSDTGVKVVFVNIFGGIVRCDRVANGLVSALQNIGKTSIPVIIRLQGTNLKEALEIINNSGINVFITDSLGLAADMIKLKLSEVS